MPEPTLGLGASTNASESSGCNSGFRMPIRCLIVDDNSYFRQEMSALLEEQGIEVVGCAANGDEAIQQIADLRPDVALIDIDLGGESGLALVRRLHNGAHHGVPPLILISIHEEREYADLIDESPAIGFLAKTEISEVTIRQMLAEFERPRD